MLLEDICNYASYNMDVETYNKTRVQEKTHNKNNVLYKILNYDKNCICFDDVLSSRYRSVILSTPGNQIFSFSSPKSIPLAEFTKRHPEIHSGIYINEWVEGVMINLFFDERIQRWEISTKSAIGGNYYFYHNQHNCENIDNKTTFYEMFMDALKVDRTRRLNDIPLLESFEKGYSYSFVLQHPENHIILKHDRPKLYLVGVYDIDIFNRVISIPPSVYEEWDIFQGLIDFPKQYTPLMNSNDTAVQSSSKLSVTDSNPQWYNNITHYAEFSSAMTCEKGIMITDLNSGDRTSVLNPNYELYKKTRKINPNIYYQYLCLRSTAKVDSFLLSFPSYQPLFNELEIIYKQWICDLHSSYLSFYVKKDGQPIQDKYMYHIRRIHKEMYIPTIKNTLEKPKIRKQEVNTYFSGLDPNEQLYHLHYDSREFSIPDSLRNN